MTLDKKLGARKSLGQHFLRDAGVLTRIVDLLDPRPADRILEIGPGQGALSEGIGARGPLFFAALEKDLRLALRLGREYPSMHVAAVDAMRFCWEKLERGPAWKLAGNLPYNIASPLMWDIFSGTRNFSRAVFMVQKEVAMRVVAAPGSKIYGALSVWLQSHARVKLVFKVAPGSFWPRPKVDSAVLFFEPRPEKLIFNSETFSMLLRRCFQGRRKQLGNILKDLINKDIVDYLQACGKGLQSRPEELDVTQFQRLATLIEARGA